MLKVGVDNGNDSFVPGEDAGDTITVMTKDNDDAGTDGERVLHRPEQKRFPAIIEQELV